MDWQTTSVILGILGTIAVAIIRFSPERKHRTVEQKMDAAQEPNLGQRLERIQEDVNRLEVDMGVVQTEQTRTASDITGVRNEVGELRKEISALRTWLMEKVDFSRRPNGN